MWLLTTTVLFAVVSNVSMQHAQSLAESVVSNVSMQHAQSLAESQTKDAVRALPIYRLLD